MLWNTVVRLLKTILPIILLTIFVFNTGHIRRRACQIDRMRKRMKDAHNSNNTIVFTFEQKETKKTTAGLSGHILPKLHQ